MGAKHFGARVTRFEDPALLTGRGRFVDDIDAARHAARLLRAQPARAREDPRDRHATAARAMPGVHAVLTADDMPAPMRTERIPTLVPIRRSRRSRTQIALARDEVCYVGQAVAVVIADSRYLAEDAAALVEVDYEPLPAVSDCRDAVEARRAASRTRTSPTTSPPSCRWNTATSTPPSPGRRTFSRKNSGMHRGGGMPHGAARRAGAATTPATDMLTVWSATQTPHLGRRILADLLERDLESIRVVAPDVGGGFGTKAPFYPEEA